MKQRVGMWLRDKGARAKDGGESRLDLLGRVGVGGAPSPAPPAQDQRASSPALASRKVPPPPAPPPHRKGLVHGKPEEKNHTTHRMTYMRRSEKDLKELAEKAAEQVATSKAARYTSSIPLGHQGIMSLPSWGTSNAGYGSRDTAGLVLDKNEAARNKQVHSGITAPIGASAPADTSVADFVCT